MLAAQLRRLHTCSDSSTIRVSSPCSTHATRNYSRREQPFADEGVTFFRALRKRKGRLLRNRRSSRHKSQFYTLKIIEPLREPCRTHSGGRNARGLLP